MTETRIRLGIDLGATKTLLGLVEPHGRAIGERTIPTRTDIDGESFLAELMDHARQFAAGFDIDLARDCTIGIGAPGTVSMQEGVVRYCPNLGWVDEPVADIVERLVGNRPLVLQDSWCAAWAERLFGAPAGTKDLLAITVGTGIGAGVILDGELLVGALGAAGELGHTIAHLHGRPCTCGRAGCLEQYCSGTAIAAITSERLSEETPAVHVTAPAVFAMAARGHGRARAVLREAIDELARAIANAVNLLSIEQVIIGGGLGAQHALFVTPLRERVLELGYSPWLGTHRFRLEPSRLGPAAPMIGAAFLDTLRINARDKLPAPVH